MKVTFKTDQKTITAIIEAMQPHVDFWNRNWRTGAPEVHWGEIPAGVTMYGYTTTGINRYGHLWINSNDNTITFDGQRGSILQSGTKDAVRVILENAQDENIVEYKTTTPELKWHESAHGYIARKGLEAVDNKTCVQIAVRDALAYLHEKGGADIISADQIWFRLKSKPDKNAAVMNAANNYFVGIDEEMEQGQISCKGAAEDKKKAEKEAKAARTQARLAKQAKASNKATWQQMMKKAGIKTR